jgi:hypothetical protein
MPGCQRPERQPHLSTPRWPRRRTSMSDAADDEPANAWSPSAPMTTAIAVRTVGRVGLLFVLARCRS